MSAAERQRAYRERMARGEVVVKLPLDADQLEKLEGFDLDLFMTDADHPEYRERAANAVRKLVESL